MLDTDLTRTQIVVLIWSSQATVAAALTLQQESVARIP